MRVLVCNECGNRLEWKGNKFRFYCPDGHCDGSLEKIEMSDQTEKKTIITRGFHGAECGGETDKYFVCKKCDKVVIPKGGD